MNGTAMNALELRDIISTQLRILNTLDANDKNSGRKVDTAKQVFNGAGKLIALAAYITEAKRVGTQNDVLALPSGN